MSIIESTIVADEVYRRVRLLIIEGKLPPGSRVDRRVMATELGVSMTPVNEAVARLVGERFLERKLGTTRDSDGFFVPERPTEELAHVFAVRAGIEAMAARLCVERLKDGADPAPMEAICQCFSSYPDGHVFGADERKSYLAEDMKFHESIMEFAGNPVLTDIDRNLGCIHRSWIKGLIRPPEATLPEHREIIAAFRARDADLVHGLLIQHMLRTRAVILQSMKDGGK
ncbi:MAG: GntR family transcriptional regulator [Rectinemataceae bacterium]|nr:GntR family transcriptional regulator [Rectinemataceae bacterium]